MYLCVKERNEYIYIYIYILDPAFVTVCWRGVSDELANVPAPRSHPNNLSPRTHPHVEDRLPFCHRYGIDTIDHHRST